MLITPTKIKEQLSKVDQINIDSAFMNYLESNLIVATAITAERAVVSDLATTALNAETANIATLANESLTTQYIDANNIDTNNLTTDSAFIGYLNSNLLVANAINAQSADIAQLATQSLTAQSIDANNIDTSNLTADSAFMQYLEANLVTAGEIDVEDLKAKLAQVDVLQADSAFVRYLQSISSTTISQVVTDQYVYNAVANKITVGDLAAGDITISNSARILSENGALIMNGTALQILGTDSNGDSYVGIQLGYDTNSTPSLIVKNQDGATILTPTGITSDAIADGLIINDMVHDGTLSKNKLGFDIIEPNEYGGIDITQVYDGSGDNFGISYTSFKNSTESSLQQIENTKMYRVIVESDNGNIFKNGDINCTLSCRVFSWDNEITDEINAVNFKWTRKSKDMTSDITWNTNHSGGTKTITLTPSDVYGRSVFTCTVTLPDGTTQSSD